MLMTIFSTVIIMVVALPAFAGNVILTSQDPSPPTNSCSFLPASELPSTCYIPQYGPAPDVAGPFVWADGGQFPPIVLTLSQPTQVKITFRQNVFLNSESSFHTFGRAGSGDCHPNLPSCAAYFISVGINGTAPSQVCGFLNDGAVANGPGIGIIGMKNYDVPFASGNELEATCIITLPIGSTTVYPVEAARDGATPFKGPGEQLLLVEYND